VFDDLGERAFGHSHEPGEVSGEKPRKPLRDVGTRSLSRFCELTAQFEFPLESRPHDNRSNFLSNYITQFPDIEIDVILQSCHESFSGSFNATLDLH
jgi:hypothetical protein